MIFYRLGMQRSGREVGAWGLGAGPSECTGGGESRGVWCARAVSAGPLGRKSRPLTRMDTTHGSR